MGIPRRNISIGMPLDISIPTKMTSIEPLVENEKIIEDSKEIKNYVVVSFLTDRTYLKNPDVKVRKLIKYFVFSVGNITYLYK